MSGINQQSVDTAIDILQLHTSPADMADSINSAVEGNEAQATVGALGVLETFVGVIGRSTPAVGNTVNTAALALDLESAITQFNNTGHIDYATIEALGSDITAFSPAVVAAAAAAGLISAPVAGALAAAGVLASAALAIMSISQDDGSADINGIAEDAITNARNLASAVGDQTNDQIQNVADAVNDAIQSAQDVLGRALESIDEVGDAVGDGINNLINDIYGSPTKDAIGDFIDDVKDLFDHAAAAILGGIDPLVLDLDGDGLELTALEGSNVKFDLDANDFAETASWVSADDGLLVLDRNGNGTIDNGKELFGDHTPIDVGNAVATDGFAALADLDSNSDGIVDASDQQFSELKIWQDINQDGISDVTELSSLSDLGISSINLNPSSSGQIINGNAIPLVSTFTRSDGTTGEIGNASLQRDQINSEFVGDYQLTLDAILSPIARGYGNVADLHIATSQNTGLLALIQDLADIDLTNSSESIPSRVEEIIFEWAGTADIDPDSRGTEFDARKLEALEAFLATDFVNTMGDDTPMMANAIYLNNAWSKLVHSITARLLVQQQNNLYEGIEYQFSTDSFSLSQPVDELIDNIASYQPAGFTDGIHFWVNQKAILETVSEDDNALAGELDSELLRVLDGTPLEFLIAGIDATIYGATGNDSLFAIDGSTLIIGDGGADNLTGGTGDDVFFGGTGNDILLDDGDGGGGGNDTYIFNLGDGQDTIDDYLGADKLVFGTGITADSISGRQGDNGELILDIGSNGDQITIISWYNQYAENRQIESVEFADGTVWTSTDLHNLTLAVNGTEGIDDLYSPDSGDYTLNGLGGDDYLYGNAGNDTLNGGAGDDTLEDYDGGDDTFIGGAGNDMLSDGGGGNDTYIFNLGDGQDEIDDYLGTDKLVFGSGITTDIVSGRQGDYGELILDIGSNGDRITITNWFNDTDAQIESAEFADGTVWTSTDLHNLTLVVEGTEGNDDLYSPDSGDYTLNGLGGDDYIYGNAGNDTLNGGSGDDTLEDYDGGDDTFIGGTGNDMLSDGGGGNDTYIFNLGDGQDEIDDYLGTDKLVFGSGITADSITGRQGDYDELILYIGSNGDQITITNWFNDTDAQIESAEFADGTVWTSTDLHNLTLAVNGTEGSDDLYSPDSGDSTLNGLGGDDYLYGNAGNDTLNGGAGDDTLEDQDGGDDTFIGGTGNDTLEDGCGGNDTYIFNAGDGQDSIYDYLGDDKLVFNGINPNELWFSQSGGDLFIDHIGSDDQIAIQDWYNYASNQIETIQTSDEVLLSSSVNQLVQAMAAISTGEPGNIDDLTTQQQDDLSSAIAAAWQTS